MLWCCFLTLAAVVYAHAGTVNDANYFVDTALSERLPLVVRQSPALYPAVRIPFSDFEVPKNAITNRDLHVNLTEGTIRDLDTVPLRRLGDCQVPSVKAGPPSILCTVDLSGINTTFLALTRGDNVLATLKEIWVHVVTVDSNARLEVTGSQTSEASLRTFELINLQFSTTYDRELHLNTDRQRLFKEHVERKVKETLQDVVFNELRILLSRSVNSLPFPRV
ncbi:unnamed protein product [Ixodes hexagonus]